jgi:molybdopterin-binding protein
VVHALYLATGKKPALHHSTHRCKNHSIDASAGVIVMVASQASKEQVFANFEQILADRKKLRSRIATKEEEAASARNEQVLDVVSAYTVDGIVKGLADLQLEFGGIVTQLSEKLSAESLKLKELDQAIAIETHHLQMLQQICVVADTLHLLTQTHQEELRSLEQRGAEQQAVLEKEIAEARSLWAKEQADFEQTVREQIERLTKERERQEADYLYELERQRTIDANEFDETRRNQEKALQDTEQVNERQWTERETILAENQPLLEDYQQRVDRFSAELDKLVEKTRTDAATAVQQNAAVQAELLEKEWEATRQGYELTIQSLEQTIQEQTRQLESINAQLQATMQQSHTLTMKAFEKSSTVAFPERGGSA